MGDKLERGHPKGGQHCAGQRFSQSIGESYARQNPCKENEQKASEELDDDVAACKS
ncbi:hypothetical protein [Desulfitobacterium sp. LBE]|uniref:hypothetical protein n=1 Tax=Desulfitobacterium sp. LBE TaxID=884086 RepID=UPI00155AF829|nr:hypothetical protein [Desulfitobacterium sp. LBE]